MVHRCPNVGALIVMVHSDCGPLSGTILPTSAIGLAGLRHFLGYCRSRRLARLRLLVHR
jgi:hypothetical protein